MAKGAHTDLSAREVRTMAGVAEHAFTLLLRGPETLHVSAEHLATLRCQLGQLSRLELAEIAEIAEVRPSSLSARLRAARAAAERMVHAGFETGLVLESLAAMPGSRARGTPAARDAVTHATHDVRSALGEFLADPADELPEAVLTAEHERRLGTFMARVASARAQLLPHARSLPAGISAILGPILAEMAPNSPSNSPSAQVEPRGAECGVGPFGSAMQEAVTQLQPATQGMRRHALGPSAEKTAEKTSEETSEAADEASEKGGACATELLIARQHDGLLRMIDAARADHVGDAVGALLSAYRGVADGSAQQQVEHNNN